MTYGATTNRGSCESLAIDSLVFEGVEGEDCQGDTVKPLGYTGLIGESEIAEYTTHTTCGVGLERQFETFDRVVIVEDVRLQAILILDTEDCGSEEEFIGTHL